jgi:hypothetical protein
VLGREGEKKEKRRKIICGGEGVRRRNEGGKGRKITKH